jgi:hypothetical protein
MAIFIPKKIKEFDSKTHNRVGSPFMSFSFILFPAMKIGVCAQQTDEHPSDAEPETRKGA